MERPVQAKYQTDRQIRQSMGRRDVDRNISREAGEQTAKKSCYCFL
jgi:hypothetical protein